jgi:class 3 adenylate cyclase
MLTMVFTDLVNSTAVKAILSGADLHERNRVFLTDILSPHRDRVAAFLLEFNGKIVERMGDGYFLMFDRATDAARFAVALQVDAAQRPIATPLGPVQVRIGLHSGDPLPDPKLPGQYVGQEIDYAARLAALATGGQILISNLTRTLIEEERMSDARSWKHGDRNPKGSVRSRSSSFSTPADRRNRCARRRSLARTCRRRHGESPDGPSFSPS